MSTPEKIRRAPRYMNWPDHRPSFKGIESRYIGRYELRANELDRLGKVRAHTGREDATEGEGVVGTFRNRAEAKVAAQAMRADHVAFDPSITIDSNQRFRDFTIDDEEDFKRDYELLRQEHYQTLESQPKVLNPFTHDWPGRSPTGEFSVSALRLDQKDMPRQMVARFDAEEDALACYDALILSHGGYTPKIKVSI